MIKVRIVQHPGNFTIIFNGHATPPVCAAASMIMQAAALGLEDIAKQFPKQIQVETYRQNVDKEAEGWVKTPASKDRRKR